MNKVRDVPYLTLLSNIGRLLLSHLMVRDVPYLTLLSNLKYIEAL